MGSLSRSGPAGRRYKKPSPNPNPTPPEMSVGWLKAPCRPPCHCGPPQARPRPRPRPLASCLGCHCGCCSFCCSCLCFRTSLIWCVWGRLDREIWRVFKTHRKCREWWVILTLSFQCYHNIFRLIYMSSCFPFPFVKKNYFFFTIYYLYYLLLSFPYLSLLHTPNFKS